MLSGLKIVKESKIDASNLYYNRDYRLCWRGGRLMLVKLVVIKS